MTVNEATVLAQAADAIDKLTGLVGDLSSRVTRLENALCILVSDETLPMDTRMDVASALLPDDPA
jgi:hypothetical protein